MRTLYRRTASPVVFLSGLAGCESLCRPDSLFRSLLSSSSSSSSLSPVSPFATQDNVVFDALLIKDKEEANMSLWASNAVKLSSCESFDFFGASTGLAVVECFGRNFPGHCHRNWIWLFGCFHASIHHATCLQVEGIARSVFSITKIDKQFVNHFEVCTCCNVSDENPGASHYRVSASLCGRCSTQDSRQSPLEEQGAVIILYGRSPLHLLLGQSLLCV
jgi:hypothetical protein